MAGSDTNTSWEKIRRNVKDAEVLISQKKYNLSMVKSRQALESMIRTLCENASIGDMDLASSIDALYSSRWISKTTCEHYHKIRMLGNKAVHEGSDDAYEANQAYHLLSQEAYTFFHEYNNGKRGPAPSQSQPRRRSSSKSAKSRRRAKQSGYAFSSYDVVRIVFAVLVIILIVVLINVLKPKKEKESDDATQPSSSASITETLPEPETTTAPETMAPTTPAPVYKTSDHLNVRSAPSVDSEKLGLLSPGTTVEYIEDHDDEWAVILYEGREAYVSSQYLVHD